MVRTQIQLTEEQARALRQAAAARGLSMAEVLREGLETYLSSTANPNRAEVRRRAVAAAGAYRSGLGDLSTKHDEYLAATFQP